MGKTLFSIGSKRENAKTINVKVTKFRIFMAIVFFILLIVMVNYMYQPDSYVECADGNRTKIKDNLTSLCGVNLPTPYMTEQEIVDWVKNDYFPNLNTQLPEFY